KLEELRLSGLESARMWPGLLDPAVLVVGWLYLDVLMRGWTKAIWLAILVLVNLLLILGFIGYLHFGGFYRPELFASQSLSRMLANAEMLLTWQSALSLLSVLLKASVFAAVAALAIQKLRPRLSTRAVLHISAGAVVLYGIVVAFLSPPRIEALRLSLAVTVDSLIPTHSAEVNWTDAPTAVSATAPAAPMSAPRRSKPYNLVIYVMESTRASVMQVNG